MNGKYLIDTNIFIYLSQGDENIANIIQDKDIYISFVTELELLSFKKITGKEEKLISEILSHFKILDLNSSLKKIIIDLRKKYNLKLPDSIILASAKYLGIPFLTSDIRLKKIEEVDIILYEL
jgi:predicted nucleic acid-binding protein